MSRVDRYYGEQAETELNHSEQKAAYEAARKQRTPRKQTRKQKPEKKRGKFRIALRIILILIVVGIAAGGTYAAICIAGAPTIHPENIYDTLSLSTNIYDDEGNQIDSVYAGENRKIASYDQFPEDLVNAFVAVEDKTFWKHHGFNFKRMIGAVLKSVGGGGISGTSTITQQLARNVYLPDIKSVRSIKRKIIEMYYAYEIEKALSKEEILEAYLNTIYLGYGNYGVTSAAKVYFSSSVSDLTLEQCAALAALPQAPDSYALIKNEESEYTTEISSGIYANDVSVNRRNMILELMSDQGYITADEAASAEKPLSEFIKPNFGTEKTSHSYFTDYVIDTVVSDIMKEYDKTEQEARNMVYTKGLRIYSTLDSQAQAVISREFKDDDNFPTAAEDAEIEASMVITEVGTGAIKAMAGGRNPQGQLLFNRATSPRQPGSSIKPLTVYSAALQKSLELQAKGDNYSFNGYGKEMGTYITVSSSVTDDAMTVDGATWPKNSDGKYSGANTFRTAIQQSINTCAVKILMQVGVGYAMDQLRTFGITTAVSDEKADVNDMNLAALALGAMAHGVTPLQMSLAYAAFPGDGRVYTPICYTTVEDADGNVILTSHSDSTQVLDPGVAWIMTDVLKSVVTDGIATNAAVKGIEVGGKTGTTDDRYDIWFDGFTANYSAALWIGTDKNKSLSTMSGTAAALWGKIMSQIDKAKTGSYSEKPSNVVEKYGKYYTKGTEPEEDPHSAVDDEVGTGMDGVGDDEYEAMPEMDPEAVENAG